MGSLLGSLVPLTVPAWMARSALVLVVRIPPTGLPMDAAALAAVGAIAAKLLAAALLPMSKAVLTPAGLTDGEVWSRTLRWRLPANPGQRRSNQRTVHRPFFFGLWRRRI